MGKSISVKRKRPGRPATGTEPLYGVRIGSTLMKEIMDWAKAEGASRSEAIRRLVELGLLAQKSPDLRYQTRAHETAREARKLASELGLRTKSK